MKFISFYFCLISLYGCSQPTQVEYNCSDDSINDRSLFYLSCINKSGTNKQSGSDFMSLDDCLTESKRLYCKTI